MPKLTAKELADLKKSERLLIQSIDRDMEDVMYYEDEIDAVELLLMDTYESLELNKKSLKRVQSYLGR